MNHIFLTISIMSFSLTHSLNAMDEAPKQKPLSLDSIVAELIHALEPHNHFDLFANIAHDFGFMPESEAFAIIQNINISYTQKYPTEQRTKEIFNILYTENNLFRYAIKCLQKYAHNNLRLLTGETLAIIENPEADQPCTELNALPPLIKKYLMEKTLDEYNDTSTIALKKKSWHPIVAFDICEITHQAATSDTDYNFCLWDLKTTQKITKQKLQHTIKQICFNNDGSLIAARSNKQVAIWAPTNDRTLTLRYTLQLNPEKLPLYHMQYAQETAENLLSIFHRNIHTEGASTWATNQNKNQYICFQKDVAPIDSQPLDIEKGIYSARNPSSQHNQSTLYVTKKNCHSLVLCKLAARQTEKTEGILKIFSAESYKPLVLHDCNEIHKELKKNACFNKNTQPVILIEK
jgi:hypothetical protein